jgi:hypothetical protein
LKKGKIYLGKKWEELNVYEKRFIIMMKLYRIGKMMEKAKITNSSNENNKDFDQP